MYNKVFEINFAKLAVLLLPLALRKTLMIALNKAMVQPITSLHYQFMQKRTKDNYQLAHNSQVCYLQAALNDSFDVEARRIIITDGNKFKRSYIYTRAENKTKWLGTFSLYARADYADTGIDFIVEVPTETYNKHGMEALINKYRLASKRYQIIQT